MNQRRDSATAGKAATARHGLPAATAMAPAAWLAAVLALAMPLATPPAMAAEPPTLGRLFNTPEQRAQLDAQRYGATQPPPVAPPAPPAAAPVPPPPPAPLVLNGVVRPARGKATVWLNQEPVADSQRIVGRDGKVTLILPSGQRVTLKPGQRYDESTGEVRDDGQ